MRLEGAMTALITPMKGGEVDTQALCAIVEQQIAGGIAALVAVGTTGESATLTPDEDIAVVSEVVKAAAGRVPVIAGAGSNNTQFAIRQSKRCLDVGADALLHVCPYYNKPTQDGMFAHFEAIATAAPAPIVLYNVPGRTVSDLLPSTVARLADIDNIIAIKEATADLRRASQIIDAAGDRIAVLSGDDFTAFPLYCIGGRGVISVVSNVLPRQMAEMWSAVKAGDFGDARDLHYDVMPLTELLFEEPNPTPVKAAMNILGLCSDEIRLPLLPCSPPLRERIEAELRRGGHI